METDSGKQPPSLLVALDGREVCRFLRGGIPAERKPSFHLDRPGGTLEFHDPLAEPHRHALDTEQGWLHMSIRVTAGLACQADIVVTGDEAFDEGAFQRGEAQGIRFQPFFLTGGLYSNEMFRGRGLFRRGLHYRGTVSSGNLSLSCTCDDCRRSFRIRSFHAGFSSVAYFYSDSGKHTLTVSDSVPGAPPALSEPDHGLMAQLEARLPLAPDGTRFRYLNPFRCPHCGAPYIDFAKHPEERIEEYCGNYFMGCHPMHYDPDQAQ